jgi:hypothetical protein
MQIAIELVRIVPLGVDDQPVGFSTMEIVVAVVKRFEKYGDIRAMSVGVDRGGEIVDDVNIGDIQEQIDEYMNVLP